MDEQLKELLRQRQFDEALALAEESSVEVGLENAKEKLSMVHAQAGFLLFFDLRFRDAIDHFLQSSVMHPAEISLFPKYDRPLAWCGNVFFPFLKILFW